MTAMSLPYPLSDDPAARRWWSGLSQTCRRELARSWRGDDAADPLRDTAHRVAGFLNDCERGREDAERAWEPLDFYEHLVAHDTRGPAIYCDFHNRRSLLDHGMFWPVARVAREWTIDSDRCRPEQHALLAMQAGGG